jgi:hypothetical protein
MKYKNHIFITLGIMLLMFLIGATFLVQPGNKYEHLANDIDFLALETKIQNQNDIEIVKKTALLLHEESANNAKGNSAMLHSLSKLFVALFFICLITLVMFYKYSISNNAFKRDADKAPHPLS